MPQSGKHQPKEGWQGTAGDWCGQGSARRQRLAPLGVSRAELPSCGQSATGATSRGKTPVVVRSRGCWDTSYTHSQSTLWGKSGNKTGFFPRLKCKVLNTKLLQFQQSNRKKMYSNADSPSGFSVKQKPILGFLLSLQTTPLALEWVGRLNSRSWYSGWPELVLCAFPQPGVLPRPGPSMGALALSWSQCCWGHKHNVTVKATT